MRSSVKHPVIGHHLSLVVGSGHESRARGVEQPNYGNMRRMGLVLLLLLLALLFGGVGLFVEGLKWALIIALALVIAGAISGGRIGRRM